MRFNRVVQNAAIGAALSLGAPGGWLAWRLISGDVDASFGAVAAELEAARALYVYLAIGTCAAFTAFGAALGVADERLARANASLEEQTITDALTGLRNPRYFHARLDEECNRARRDGAPLALIILDLDHFKRVNDTHGHAAGDRVLETAAQVLKSSARASDVACRIGGEEFAVLCPRTTLEEAEAIAERIRTRLASARTELPGKAVQITASLGVGVRGEGDAPDALFAMADEAVYAAKRRGRNQVARPATLRGSVVEAASTDL